MNEMIERLTILIGSSDVARRVLEVMREPTQKMIDSSYSGHSADMKYDWQCMIDAALADE